MAVDGPWTKLHAVGCADPRGTKPLRNHRGELIAGRRRVPAEEHRIMSLPARDALVRPHSLRPSLLGLLAAHAFVVLFLSVINIVAPQRGGPLALSQIFAPLLSLSLVALVPVALRSPGRGFRVALFIGLAISVMRFGSGLVSIPPQPPGADELIVRVMTWNLEGDASMPDAVLAHLRASDADVVALQELTPAYAVAIQMDRDLTMRYREMALVPRGGADGIGVLSRFPITSATHDLNPAIQEIELSFSDRELTIINAHPLAPRFPLGQAAWDRLGYDARQRDVDIRRIRGSIDRALAMRRSVIVLGDFNVTDREPAFDDLARGLWDAHEEVGQGFGSTWRPSQVAFVPLGLLRIDHFLGGPGTRPLRVVEDCTPLSDHCILEGDVAVD